MQISWFGNDSVSLVNACHLLDYNEHYHHLAHKGDTYKNGSLTDAVTRCDTYIKEIVIESNRDRVSVTCFYYND